MICVEIAVPMDNIKKQMVEVKRVILAELDVHDNAGKEGANEEERNEVTGVEYTLQLVLDAKIGVLIPYESMEEAEKDYEGYKKARIEGANLYTLIGKIKN